MSYVYSFDTKAHTLSPADFVQEQNDLFEEENFNDELEALFLPVGEFDPYETL